MSVRSWSSPASEQWVFERLLSRQNGLSAPQGLPIGTAADQGQKGDARVDWSDARGNSLRNLI